MKKNRIEAIQSLIAEEKIEDQESLVKALKEKYGILTSQVQVSRDLRTLGISKKKIGEKMVYDLSGQNQVSELLRLAILQIVHNEALIVIKTRPGLAAFVGDYVDALENPEILCTLAGENVVLVTPRSIKEMSLSYKNVCAALYFKQGS